LTPEDSKIVIASDDEQEHQRDEALIDVPRRSPRNTETLVADPRVLPDANNWYKQVQIKHEPELQGGFKALRDKGLRITNYQEDIPK
jgi:hypothetical protein